MNPLPGAEGNLTWAPVNMQDSSRMLDTESIQDQPIDAAPATQETKGLRSYFAAYSSGFLSIFKDAVGRITSRSKRDADSVTQILAPVLQSITFLIEGEAQSQFQLSDDWHASDKTQRDYIKSLTNRASEWKAEDKDTIASAELNKAVRSLYYAVYREAGAAIAETKVQEVNDEQ
jgi:hypothetical protein